MSGDISSNSSLVNGYLFMGETRCVCVCVCVHERILLV